MKQKVTVNIDQKIYEKAHRLGLNVSKVSENALTACINAIETTNNKPSFLTPGSFTKETGWCGSRDLNPGHQRGSVDWIGFREYVAKDHKPRVAEQLASNAEKYCVHLLNRDLSAIRDLDDTVRRGAMCALSALAKYLGCHDDFKRLVAAYGLKWVGRSADDLIIERLTRDADPEMIWTWIRTVKEKRPELSDFMDLSAVSGLRFAEAVHSYNLIVELTRKGKLDSSYFVAERSTLEHFRFKEVFLRRSKKAFVSFVPESLVRVIGGKEELLNSESVKTVVRRKHLPLRFGDIREAHGTFMIRYLKKEEVDFLHGRVTSGVFMQHYFNPALIADLKSRVFQGIGEIQEKVRV